MSIFDFFKKKKDPAGLTTLALSLAKNEIVMEVNEDARCLAPFASKLGGKPYLPVDFAWPRFSDEGEEAPLSFLCQINLADVKPYDQDGLLPPKGLTLFLL